MAQWIEIVGGAVATLVGVAVAGVMMSLGAYFWAVAITGLGGIGAGAGVYLHVVDHRQPGLALLWLSWLGLAVMTVLGAFSVGVFILPGTLAALIAAVAGTVRSTAGRLT